MTSEFNLIIERYNPLAGLSLQTSLLIAKERAKEKDCTVLLRFNDIVFFINKNSDCEFLENYYHYERYVNRYRIAMEE